MYIIKTIMYMYWFFDFYKWFSENILKKLFWKLELNLETNDQWVKQQTGYYWSMQKISY